MMKMGGDMKIPVNLTEIEEILVGDNPALKKRALAIVLNDSVIEARELVEKLAASETDTEIQALAGRVAKELQRREEAFTQGNLESIVDTLEITSPESRVAALRRLLHRKSKLIPHLIRRFFFSETRVESATLIVSILENNPDPLNLEQLTSFLRHPNEDIRFKSFEAIGKNLMGAVYPEMLRSLIDANQRNKMQGYQFLGRLGRKDFVEILQEMMKNRAPEMTRLAANLCFQFLGKDLSPVLRPHLSHVDEQTASLVRMALESLAEQGDQEAKGALGIKEETPPEVERAGAGVAPDNLEKLQELVQNIPPWLFGDLAKEDSDVFQVSPIKGMEEVFSRIREFFAASYLCDYLASGMRDRGLDTGCFRAIRQGPKKCNAVQLLQAFSHALPKPSSAQDLFPRLIAQKVFTDEADLFIEQIMSFQEVFDLVADNPGEADKLLGPTIDGFATLMEAVGPLKNNRLVVKILVRGQVRFYDFNTSPITPIEPQLLANFDFPMNEPTLISGDFSRALSLSPYLWFDPEKSEISFHAPNEEQLLGFLSRNNIMSEYLNFIVDPYASENTDS